MTFNQALNLVDLYAFVIVMGGPAHSFEALTVDQTILFEQEMYRLAQTHMGVHKILERDGQKSQLLADCYDRYIQHTSLKTPIAYALVHASNSSGALVFTHQTSPIKDCEVANLNIYDKVGDNEVICYDYSTLGDWNNYCYINKQQSKFRLRAAQDTYRLPKIGDLNALLSLRKIPFGMDIIAHPMVFLRDHQERLLTAIAKQAEGLAKVCIYG